MEDSFAQIDLEDLEISGKIIKHDKKSDKNKNKLKFSELMKDGETFYSKKQYAKSIESYKAAIKINQYHSKAYSGLAKSLFANNQKKQALLQVEKALEVDSNNSDGYYCAGLIYEDKK